MINAYVKTAAAALLAATAFGEMSDAERHHSTEMNSTAYAADRRTDGGVKVLFIGNSITLHGPNAAIGWTNNWGMAASAADKDFVHLVTREVERRLGRRADLVVRNYANFERDFSSWDWSKTEELAKEDPDVLVIALGENVRSLKGESDRLAWRDAFKRLLGAFLDGRNTKPLAVVRGSFWPDADKDWAMAYAASDYAIPFVKSDVYTQPGMDASDAGFSHPGVKAHPGDRGMAEIAARIVEGLFPEQSGYEAWMDGRPVKVHAIQVSAMEYNRLFTGFQRPVDQTERAGFAAVEAKGATSWRVKSDRAFKKAVVRPLSAGVMPAVKDGVVEFTLPKCGHYVLELDDYHRPLEIFVEPENDFAEYRRTATVTFGPGVHLTRGVRLRSHDRVYIDKDAVVYGGFAMDGVEDVQIRGYGIICGTTCRRVKAYYNRNPDDKAGEGDMVMRQLTPIRARRSKRIVVEGPVVVDSCEWCVATFGCEDVDVSHLKITGAWRYNTDGIDFCNTRNARLADSYIHSFDDSVVLKGILPDSARPVENVKVERCVCWCGWGRTLENGLETWASAWRNIVFEDCDLIHNSMAALSVHLGGPCAVDDVTFRDIRIEYDASRSEPEYQRGRDDVYAKAAKRPAVDCWFAALNAKMYAPGSMYKNKDVSPNEPFGSFRRCLLEDIDILVEDGVPLPKAGVWFQPGTKPGEIELRNVRMNGKPVTQL